MIGKPLSNFQCTELLGKGGMGEVYRAKDQKLGRDVAIKVLPEEFAKDADRVARFQREAKLLASLNHPNIASIYGLEESDGTHFLVLELIEGDTLADRLKRGAIPVEESLKLALQIAEALEAAHEKGVIHRDLKPANIKVTPDGKVKVLDFGLAKAFAGEQGDMNLSNSPTLSVAATQQGIILGTAAYMSPEQASGETTDKRTDIWAFGVVLFEMLTGSSLFEGNNVSQTLASVIKSEPEWQTLPPNLHPRIRFLLERCLKKEPKSRYSGISDARIEIQEVLADPSGVFAQPVTTVKPRKIPSLKLPWVAAAILLSLIVAGVAVWHLKPEPPPEPKQVIRFEYELPEGQQLLQIRNVYSFTLSRDGSQLAYGTTTEGIYLRSMGELDARLIGGTDRYTFPLLFSPDGQWICYWDSSDRKLMKVSIRGGAPIPLCDTGTLILGADWDSDGTIVYSDLLGGGIMRVSANGGIPEPLVKGSMEHIAEEGLSVFPQMLPDGKTLMFTHLKELNLENAQIVIQSLESGDRKVLIKGGAMAQYLPTGHIVYRSAVNNINSLLAIPFDLDTLEVTGSAVSFLEGFQNIAISDSGTLAYVLQAGVTSTTSPGRTLVWVDREGKEEPLNADPGEYNFFKISPDGNKVALTVGSTGRADVWIYDLDRENLMRLTLNEGNDATPLWTPDGKRIIYYSSREGPLLGNIYWKKADGIGEVEKLGSAQDGLDMPFSSTRDGRTLAIWELKVASVNLASGNLDISLQSMEGDRERVPLLHEAYNETYPQISPDGRWIAYQSDESGRYEVLVRSFPDVDSGGRWQVSTNGGDSPLWSPDGKELFYRNGNSFMAVDVETEPTFYPGKPRELFKGTYFSSTEAAGCTPWDIHPNGKKFLLIKPPEVTAAEPASQESAVLSPRKINIVLNWFEELKDRVPVH